MPYQEKFPEPRRVTEYYAAAGDSDLSAKTFLSVNWLLNWDRVLSCSAVLIPAAALKSRAKFTALYPSWPFSILRPTALCKPFEL